MNVLAVLAFTVVTEISFVEILHLRRDQRKQGERIAEALAYLHDRVVKTPEPEASEATIQKTPDEQMHGVVDSTTSPEKCPHKYTGAIPAETARQNDTLETGLFSTFHDSIGDRIDKNFEIVFQLTRVFRVILGAGMCSMNSRQSVAAGVSIFCRRLSRGGIRLEQA